MKKSEIRSLIRECIHETLTEIRLMHNFRNFVNSLPNDIRDEFVDLFGVYLGVPLESGHDVEKVTDQVSKIDSVIKSLPVDLKKKYIPILTKFKEYVVHGSIKKND